MATSSQFLKSGATSPQHGLLDRLTVWRDQHRDQAQASVRRLREKPVTSGIVLIVLAIAILLPTLLYMGLKNAESWLDETTIGLEVSVFLQPDTPEPSAHELTRQMEQWPGVSRAAYISREQAAKSLTETPGIDEILASLPNNPLPPTIQLTLATDASVESVAHQLVERAESIGSVASASFNLEWFRKAQALINFLQRIVSATALLLGLGVMLVIGNTVKSAIDLRKDEILITKLVGATNGFVRRPFLYMGVWLGALGALLSVVLSYLSMLALTYYIEPLNQAYNLDMGLSGLSLSAAAAIITSSSALGWAGAWLICNAQIRAFTSA